MLTYLIPSRRRAENRRVERFLHAIRLSERYAVNPDWNLTPVAGDSRTDTVAFPRIILAGTVLTAAVALGACATPAESGPAQVTARPVVEQPDMSGPGRAWADHQLREAVRGIAPWLVR